MPSERLIEVALPLPLFRTFTYAVGGEHMHEAREGSRVVVPLRTGTEIGICLGASEGTGTAALPKPVRDVPDPTPVLDRTMLQLCRWIAEYYVVPLGVVVRAALPVLLTGASHPNPRHKTRRVVRIDRDIPSLLGRDRLFARAKQQRALYELLESLGGRSPFQHLTEQLRFSPSVLKALVARGLVTVEEEIITRDPFLARERRPAPRYVPTAAQSAAVEALVAAPRGSVSLLHGVTGSGKTLVYTELLREIVERRGQTAIVLVPEIALTPQTVDRFRAIFGDAIAVLHSALSDGERYDAWVALRNGEKRIAVGARSAVFAPLRNLGAIIVDEEHEGSYKQGESPRYHAREVAIVRARLEGAVAVLGSATPSLESWRNAAAGKFRLLTLPERVGGGRLPTVSVVDLRRGAAQDAPAAGTRGAAPGDPFRYVISEALEDALRDRLARREQSILLLNRRGYASFVQCGACGDVTSCPHCSITLTYHRAPEGLICHYCLHKEAPHVHCRRCGGTLLRQRGVGTQQVERLLADRFAAARIARMDMDTTSGKWAHTEILDRVGRGEVDILLGTQMIAKGLDFPDVTLVGVVDADVGINLPDFRASERSFQLLSQVAGRAGRGPKGGAVIIQTRVPSHHAVRCAVNHDYQAFLREELPSRERPAYPPTVRLVNIIISGTREEPTMEAAVRAGEWLGRLLERTAAPIEIIGPAPCPIERIKNRWRWHLLLRTTRARALTRIGRYFLQRFELPKGARMRVALDRDPVALL